MQQQNIKSQKITQNKIYSKWKSVNASITAYCKKYPEIYRWYF